MYLFRNKFADSLQAKCRKKRNLFFLSLFTPINKRISILDVGGTVEFWENTDLINNNNVHITLLNLQLFKSEYSNIESVVGDARNLQMYRDNEFDIVFSNSVIEHVGDFDDQRKMANEIKRVGKAYFLQTPNYYFPIEPHYRTIGFQFLPYRIKVFVLNSFGVGRVKRCTDKNTAINESKRIRLLTLRELKHLFPHSNIFKERFLGFTKSLIVYDGFKRK